MIPAARKLCATENENYIRELKSFSDGNEYVVKPLSKSELDENESGKILKDKCIEKFSILFPKIPQG